MDGTTLKDYRILRVKVPRLDSRIMEETNIAQGIVKAGTSRFGSAAPEPSKRQDIRFLQAERLICAQKCRNVELFIAAIEDCLTRDIFEMRYVEGMPWRDIAQRIGGDNTSDSVRMRANRYLKKC